MAAVRPLRWFVSNPALADQEDCSTQANGAVTRLRL